MTAQTPSSRATRGIRKRLVWDPLATPVFDPRFDPHRGASLAALPALPAGPPGIAGHTQKNPGGIRDKIRAGILDGIREESGRSLRAGLGGRPGENPGDKSGRKSGGALEKSGRAREKSGRKSGRNPRGIRENSREGSGRNQRVHIGETGPWSKIDGPAPYEWTWKCVTEPASSSP